MGLLFITGQCGCTCALYTTVSSSTTARLYFLYTALQAATIGLLYNMGQCCGHRLFVCTAHSCK
jgi:hypothetical protein